MDVVDPASPSAARLVPGPATAIVSPNLVALVLAPPEDPVVVGLWSVLAADGGFDAAVGVLGSQNFSALPPLALLGWDDANRRIIVRGDVVVTLAGPDGGPLDLRGGPVHTWSEHAVDGLGPVRLATAAATSVDPGASGFLVVRGVVPAAAIAVYPVAGGPGASAAGESPAAVPVPDAASLPVVDDSPALPPLPASPDPSLADLPPPPGALVPPGPASIPPPPPGDPTGDLAEAPPAPPMLVPPVAIAAVPALGEATAVIPARDGLADEPVTRAVDQPDVSLAGSSPGEAPPESPPLFDQDAPDEPTGADHDGMTVTFADLEELLGGRPVAAPATGDEVEGGDHLAVRCHAGHLNPAGSDRCRACNGTIPAQEPISLRTPVLGAFRFSTGTRVPVVRPMLIGRSPKLSGAIRGQVPELVSVPSPQHDISRTHLEVRLDGWEVWLVDKGSTNGTVVTLLNRDPQRLRPDHPFPLPLGSRVSLAGEVDFVYEAIT